MDKTKEERAELLQEAITILDTAYDEDQDCLLPDELANQLGIPEGIPVPNKLYDMMRQELMELRPEALDEVTRSEKQSTVSKVIHEPAMTSISKASHEDRDKQEQMLFKWIDECSKKAPAGIRNGALFDLDSKKIGEKVHPQRTFQEKVVSYPRDFLVQAYKLDGLAIALYYENGIFIRAGLRPRDGINGEDVTEQVKYVDGIKQTLSEPITCSIRGEIICLKSDFEEVQNYLKSIGEEPRANPRNHASGGIRQFKDPTKVKLMKLTFKAYSIVNQDNPPYKTEIERAIYCNKLGIPHVQVRPFNFYELEQLEENASSLDYEVDGVVISVNDLNLQESMGRIGDPKIGNPRGKIAWKFAEERAVPVVEKIEWTVKRTGSATPVAIFKPVRLAGTWVSRATLHNLGFMIRNKIDVGTKIVVIKSGKIIPKVIGVVSGEVDNPYFPKTCPTCGESLVKEQNGDNWELVCYNETCPAQNLSGLCHFLDVIGVLGLGESRVSKLVEGGKVKNSADFFRITLQDAIDCGLSERQSVLAMAAIHMIPSPEKTKDNKTLLQKIEKARKNKKKIPFWKLFKSLGISMAGESAGKALVVHFRTFNAIRKASVEELQSVQDVGVKTADVIYEYLHKNTDIVDDLLNFIEPELPKTGSLSNMKFCLSGGFTGGKKAVEKAIEDRGGQTGGMGKSVTALVQGSEPGADKEEAAKKHGVRIMTYQQFEKEFLK